MELTEWWLDLSPDQRERMWQHSQVQTTPASTWNAYLNRLVLDATLAWSKAEIASIAEADLPPTALPACLDIVNGTAIVLGTTRLILIPDDTIDAGELVVPQEWIDIPNWVGDYYLALRLTPDLDRIQLLGYATHRMLKQQGDYDERDRTYCLDRDALIAPEALSLAINRVTASQTRAEVADLRDLSAQQVTDLIAQLAQLNRPARLALPFTLWGALVQQVDRRQQLYLQRAATAETPVLSDRLAAVTSEITRLSRWLDHQIEAAWQSVEDLLSPPLMPSFRGRTEAEAEVSVQRVKVLTFAPGERLALLVRVAPLAANELEVMVQVYPVAEAGVLPNAVQLRLLNDRNEAVSHASAMITEVIELQFSTEPGERFTIEITCGPHQRVESFEA